MPPVLPDPRSAAEPGSPGAFTPEVSTPEASAPPPDGGELARAVAHAAAVSMPDLDALRAVVAAYVKEARAAGVPAARVVIDVKAACNRQAAQLDPTRYRTLLDGVVSWAIAAYYGRS